jgi:hypothetical protein
LRQAGLQLDFTEKWTRRGKLIRLEQIPEQPLQPLRPLHHHEDSGTRSNGCDDTAPQPLHEPLREKPSETEARNDCNDGNGQERTFSSRPPERPEGAAGMSRPNPGDAGQGMGRC